MEPLEILCPSCDGSDDGCDTCDKGYITLTGCPKRWLSGWPYYFVQYAGLYKRGHGIAGSCVLDETQHFIESYSFYQNEMDRLKPDLFGDA